MDFFEAQELARKRTKWLVVWFLLAMLGVVAAVDLLVVLLFGQELSVELLSLTSIGTAGVILAASGFKSLQLNGGGAVVARDLGARQIMPGTTDFEEKRLLNVVEEMAIASGMPVPQVFLMDQEEGINAFAAGTEPSNAVIGVTRGCLQTLSRDELAGVVAHEFSHILNGDMRLNMRLMGLVFGLLVLSIIGQVLVDLLRFQSLSSRRNDREGGNAVLALFLLGVGLMVIGAIGSFFGRLIQAAVSRQREFLADASAVQFTRNPDGITGALKKIGGLQAGSRLQNSRAAEASHMFFSGGGMFSFGLATHPPLEVRIKAVEKGWNGEFKAPEPMRERPRREGGSTSARAGQDAVPAMAMMGAVAGLGGEDRRDYSRGEAIYEGIPEAWRAAVHDRQEAQALIYAFLLADEAELRDRELAHLAETVGQDASEAARRWQEEAQGLHSGRKIALIEIALPTLRGLSPSEYERFAAAIDWLIESDGEVDLFEFMLERVIARHLGHHFGQEGFAKIRYRTFDKLLPEANLLVSAIAGIGAEEAAEADAAHAAATEVWPGQFNREDEVTLSDLDPILDKFDQATPLVKRQLLIACGKAVARDGKVTSEEVELLRTIADAIGCPIPPFVEELPEGEI